MSKVLLEMAHSGPGESGTLNEREWSIDICHKIKDYINNIDSSIDILPIYSWFVSRSPDPIVYEPNLLHLSIHYDQPISSGFYGSTPMDKNRDFVPGKSKYFLALLINEFSQLKKIEYRPDRETDAMRYNYFFYFSNPHTPKVIWEAGSGMGNDHEVLFGMKNDVVKAFGNAVLKFLGKQEDITATLEKRIEELNNLLFPKEQLKNAMQGKLEKSIQIHNKAYRYHQVLNQWDLNEMGATEAWYTEAIVQNNWSKMLEENRL